GSFVKLPAVSTALSIPRFTFSRLSSFDKYATPATTHAAPINFVTFPIMYPSFQVKKISAFEVFIPLNYLTAPCKMKTKGFLPGGLQPCMRRVKIDGRIKNISHCGGMGFGETLH